MNGPYPIIRVEETLQWTHSDAISIENEELHRNRPCRNIKFNSAVLKVVTGPKTIRYNANLYQKSNVDNRKEQKHIIRNSVRVLLDKHYYYRVCKGSFNDPMVKHNCQGNLEGRFQRRKKK